MTDTDCSIIVLTPQREVVEQLSEILRDWGVKPKSAQTARECLRLMQVRPEPTSIVLCEERFADGDWKSLLAQMEGVRGDRRLVVFSRNADLKLWVDVLHWGAIDLLAEPFRADEVLPMLRSALIDIADSSFGRDGSWNSC